MMTGAATVCENRILPCKKRHSTYGSALLPRWTTPIDIVPTTFSTLGPRREPGYILSKAVHRMALAMRSKSCSGILI